MGYITLGKTDLPFVPTAYSARAYNSVNYACIYFNQGNVLVTVHKGMVSIIMIPTPVSVS